MRSDGCVPGALNKRSPPVATTRRYRPPLLQFRQQKKHNSLLLVAASRGYLADVSGGLRVSRVQHLPWRAAAHVHASCRRRVHHSRYAARLPPLLGRGFG